MFNLFKKTKNQKISEANKEYHQKHGNTRKVPIKVGNKVINYIHLNKKPAGVKFIG